MPYNPTTGIISINTATNPAQGVSILDVQRAVGRGVSDFGLLCSDKEWYENNGIRALRDAAKINPYAKYKPVRSSSLSTPNDTQRKAINFGIKAPAPSSTPEGTKQTAWEYQKPRGKGGGDNGANEWYRLLDFENYCSKATSPIVCRGDLVVTQAGGPVYPAVFPNAVGSMTFGDYGDLGTWYLCICINQTNTGIPTIKTASAPFGSNIAPSLSLSYDELGAYANGTEYYLCLCDTMQTSFGMLPAGAKYYPLPFFQGDTLNNYIGTITKQTGYDITLSFNLVLGGNSAPLAAHFSSQSFPTPPTPNYFSALPTPTPVVDPDTGEISYIIENENRYYYNANNNTSLMIRFQITGGADTIYGNSIYAKISESYYGRPTARLKMDIYKLVNGVVSKINTSEALSQNTTYIGCLYNDMLVLDSNNQRAGSVPASLTKIRPYLELFDGGGENSVKIGGVTFGVCNQSF